MKEVLIAEESSKGLGGGMSDVKDSISNLPNSGGVTSGNLTNILNWVLGMAGIVAVGVIIYGGIKYITAQGQPDKTKQASQIIAYALIGLIVVALALAITNFVMATIGESAKGSS